MTIGIRGKGLIFVISQPRAGSTLLQRMLGSHPDVHTASEPWLMLHPLYALKDSGLIAEYDARLYRMAMSDFLRALPGGEEEYIDGLRRMYVALYEAALCASGKRRFLDKTPRYYLIIPELVRVFPEAKFVILIRNPLAVLVSMLNTWIKGEWLRLRRQGIDLEQGPRCLLDGIRLLGDQAAVVRYEELVADPETKIRDLCEFLGIDFQPTMIEYGRHALPRFTFGDPNVYQHQRPITESTSRWASALVDPQVWRLTHDYLQILGRDVVERLGYSFDELTQQVTAYRPSGARQHFTFPLSWLIGAPASTTERLQGIVSLATQTARREGVVRTARAGGRKVIHALSQAG